MNDRETSERDPVPALSRGEIYYHLRNRSPREFEALIAKAGKAMAQGAADRVIAGGIITLSTICVRNCLYCGFRAQESESLRFRLSRSEVMAAAENASRAGIRWLILKAGEDPSLSQDLISELVHELRTRFNLEVTLSLGERQANAFAGWKSAGVSSYLLRHETCDPHLYRRIRPAMYWVDRLHTLEVIKEEGLALATGLLLGVPNQSSEGLVDDLLLFADAAVFCVIIEPFLPPADSPGAALISKPENQIITPDSMMMEKVIALTRILKPRALIPLDQAHLSAYQPLENGKLFRAGANGLIFDFTPVDFSMLAGQTPFVGTPLPRPEKIKAFREKLQALDLKLDFTPPVK